MKIFSTLYGYIMVWVRRPCALWYLAGLSFAESAFFPIPPDVMLAPMSLAHPQRAWRLAALATLASVSGGLLGYAIGWLGVDLVRPLLHSAGYWPAYLRAQEWYTAWGIWAILVAAFTPIPYKMFTVVAGSMNMYLGPFIIASLLGRGGRFCLVAALMAWGGPSMESALYRYADRIGLAIVMILSSVFLLYHA